MNFLNSSSLQTFKYLYSHIKRYRLAFVLIIVCSSLAQILGNIVYPLFYREFIDAITSYSGSNRQELANQLTTIIIYLGSLFFLEVVLRRIAELVNNHFQPSIMRDISNDTFKKLHNHSVSFFADNFIGSLVTKTKRLIHGFERIMDILYWEFLGVVIVAVFSTIVLFTIAPLFGWILLLWVVTYMFAVLVFSLWKMKYDLQTAAIDSQVTGNFADSLTNFFNVKIFTQLTHEKKLYQQVTEKQKKIRKFNWDLMVCSDAVQGLMMIGLEVGLLYVSMQFWLAGKITVGSIVLINTLSLQIMMKIWHFGRQVRHLVAAFADCKEMTDLLYLKREVQDVVDPEPCKISAGHIEFKSVDFAYDQNISVLKDFNLNIAAGEKIGLVGESGAGKSTLTKLLLRFNNISTGKILIDEQDISQLAQVDLRRQIAFVSQEPILFHRSLKENIQYGNLSASEEQVFEAARNAYAHGFIIKTPDGYETLVGERGVKLSGGERQRVAIARAMLAESPILILDEATSALDSKAENLIQKALEHLMKDRTTIVIAHRLSTLRMMDRIIFLEDGQIVEEGTHAELLAIKGKYAELWDEQVGGFV